MIPVRPVVGTIADRVAYRKCLRPVIKHGAMFVRAKIEYERSRGTVAFRIEGTFDEPDSYYGRRRPNKSKFPQTAVQFSSDPEKRKIFYSPPPNPNVVGSRFE